MIFGRFIITVIIFNSLKNLQVSWRGTLGPVSLWVFFNMLQLQPRNKRIKGSHCSPPIFIPLALANYARAREPAGSQVAPLSLDRTFRSDHETLNFSSPR